jgi:hypothetical protein
MMSDYPRDWNLFAFYGIFRDPRVRESSLKSYLPSQGNRDYSVFLKDVRIDNWQRHHDFGAATIEPHEGGVLHVDVVALSPDAEAYVDRVEGVANGWYRKRWARELFGYTWLGLNEPEIDCYVYQMAIEERDQIRDQAMLDNRLEYR